MEVLELANSELIRKKDLIQMCLKLTSDIKKLERSVNVIGSKNAVLKDNNKEINQLIGLFDDSHQLDFHRHYQDVIKSRMNCSVIVKCLEKPKVFRNIRKSKKRVKKVKKQFRCDVKGCHRIYKGRDSLFNHKTEHSGRFKCQDCNEHCASKSKLLEHQRLHTGEKPFGCRQHKCGMRFRRRDQLDLHCRRQHRKKWICFVRDCKRKFWCQTAFDQHLLKDHPNEKPFVCAVSWCGLSFKLKSYLDNHQKMAHQNLISKSKFKAKKKVFSKNDQKKPFRCSVDECGMRFKLAKYLKHHLKSHSDVRELKCPFEDCSFSSKYSWHLNRHVKSH